MTSEINLKREDRAFSNKIKSVALSCNGIIFGGAVRDNIIGCHYRDLFIKREKDFKLYWDKEYDVETKFRLMVPNDIDVYFRAENNSASFLNKLREFIKDYCGKITITDDANFTRLNYSSLSRFLKHRIINISVIIGRTMFSRGYKLHCKIDLVEPISMNSSSNLQSIDYHNFIRTVEPPFNNLDFLCNSFIMEKNSSGHIITRISNSTGTPIDSMVYTEKMRYSLAIIDDIVNLRTKFVRNIACPSTEFVNCYRIIKMINRFNPWTITNIPFKFLSVDDFKEKIEDKCCICLEEIDLDDPNTSIAELNTNKTKSNYLHKGCFMEFIMKEQLQKYVDKETDMIECRCPFRNYFKFRDCYKDVEY